MWEENIILRWYTPAEKMPEIHKIVFLRYEDKIGFGYWGHSSGWYWMIHQRSYRPIDNNQEPDFWAALS